MNTDISDFTDAPPTILALASGKADYNIQHSKLNIASGNHSTFLLRQAAKPITKLNIAEGFNSCSKIKTLIPINQPLIYH